MSTAESPEKTEPQAVPTVTEESNSLGSIQIQLGVIANIVRLAAQEVDGVSLMGGGFVDGIAEMFSRKDERGVKVHQEENGAYLIDIHVIMRFGVNLAQTAQSVQEVVSQRVSEMTGNPVARINVFVDGVRQEEAEKAASEGEEANSGWAGPHSES
ncbi:MAG: Asp23/Gls24 family envelope stress response protein [Verrucomicrobiota bacterium]